ncbi:hypothetical protein G4Z16_16130 [Streptomyces bathyalis]|uniref:Zinc-finger domain-containing protein n=1 Tax=Streptomyces bathyalis TaxID=2710756 RepID=A0A7T1T781_9ACTN|nr:hypothetical protein [Streptomyces bathyalis]QPP07669.1 hypothetical protein G4Z16_16130 [Streptomyces bathyalis]
MTPTPFTPGARNIDGHPDVAEISALDEDLLPRDRSSELRAHLAGCRLCADVLTSLEEIRDSLGTLPDASSMPEDIAGRIDAALAAEATLGSPRGDGAVVSRETDATSDRSAAYAKPGREAAAHRHSAAAVSRETSASRRPADRPAGRPSGGGTGPGRHRPARRVRRWRSAILAGAGAVVALGLGSVVLQSMNDSAPPTAGSGSDASERTQAGSALEKQVHGLLAKHAARESSQGNGDGPSRDFKTQESQGNTPLAGGAASMPSCVRAGIGRSGTPLAVDQHASYKGETAYLVVLPNQDDAQRVDAYVVDPSCVRDEGTGPGEVLTRHTYDRP